MVGRKRTYVSWRFAVDFEGGDLSLVGADVPVTPVITSSRGTIEIPSARPLHAIRGYRAMFDLRLPDDKPVPVELRLYLACQGQAMSETWCWQWTAPAAK